MNEKIFLLFLAISLLNIPNSPAQEERARDIVKKADDLLRGKTNRGVYEMTIITPNWQRTLRLKSWQEGTDKTFIRILYPAKDEGVGFLKIKNEVWSYLPSVERTIKIPPSLMMQPWMGSDFTNDDLVKESSIVEDYFHRLIGTEQIGGDDANLIESRPKPEAPVVWGKIIHRIRKSDFMPLKVEYYNEKGGLVRILNYSRFKLMHDRIIPTYWEMTPVMEGKKGRKTIINIVDVVFNRPLEDIFNLKSLQQIK